MPKFSLFSVSEDEGGYEILRAQVEFRWPFYFLIVAQFATPADPLIGVTRLYHLSITRHLRSITLLDGPAYQYDGPGTFLTRSKSWYFRPNAWYDLYFDRETETAIAVCGHHVATHNDPDKAHGPLWTAFKEAASRGWFDSLPELPF
jgi:hypothetical protein